MLETLHVLTHEDIMVGKKYLRLAVHLDGRLSLVYFAVRKKVGDKQIDVVARSEFLGSLDERFSLEGIGCPVTQRRFSDNHHRVFHDTMKNRQVLENLIERQAVLEWLAFLNVENPQAVLESKQKYLAEFRACLLKTQDGSVDAREEKDALLAFLDSKRL